MEASVAAKSFIKIVAVSGSLRQASYNRGLIRSAIELSKAMEGVQIEYIDIAPLPLINTDLEKDGSFLPAVEAFRQKIREADSFLFASPEYNYSIAAPLKNAIDWASRPPNVWADKGAAIISAGGGFGGGRSQYHLRQVGVFLDLHFINKPEFFLNAFQPPAKFDSDGNLIDEESKKRVLGMIEYLSYTVFEPKTQPSPFYGILWRLCSALFLNDTAFLPTEVDDDDREWESSADPVSCWRRHRRPQSCPVNRAVKKSLWSKGARSSLSLHGAGYRTGLDLGRA
ncbi:hypothetical protein ACLB2K_072781 [Fragaria x ananassa]